MSNYLTRISKRSQEVLKAFGDKKETSFRELVNKISAVGGMGSRIVESHKEISSLDFKKKVVLSDVVEEAFFNAIRMGHTYVGTEHLLLGGLIKAGYKDILTISSDVERANSLPILLKQTKGSEKISILNTYGIDLTRRYIFFPKENYVERLEVNKILKTLFQKNEPNVLLLGDEGSGKDGLIEALARKISYLDVPAYFVGTYVIDFNFQAFLSGLSSSIDAFETALKSMSADIKVLGRCIIVIKHLPNMLLASLFRNFVDTLNNAGAKLIVYADSESEDLYYGFSVVEVEEPSQKITKEILKLEAQKLQDYFLVRIPDKLINYVYTKAKSEIKDRLFPQKGILLLDKACSLTSFDETKVTRPVRTLMNRHVKLSIQVEDAFLKKDYDQAFKVTRSLKNLEKKVLEKPIIDKADKVRILNREDVDRALAEFGESDADKEYKIGTKNLSDLERRIKQRIVGQDKAVEVVTKALVRAQMGLRPKHKPVGNFLFLGPTGVGKTELGKVLAQEAFGDDSLIRLDMSDFSEKHTVARLVGSPPGYVGYNEGGELTTKIHQKPQSVVLFDEVEKAHPEVLNILLQIMDEGQLSDMRGDTYDFSNAVVVLTSNLGTDAIHKRDIGYGGGAKTQREIEDRVAQSVKSFLKPELLNRFDEIVTFRQLEKSDSRSILDILLKEIHASLGEKGIKLKMAFGVRDYLLEKGFSKEFGARSLRRTVEKELLDKLAGYMLENKVGKKPNKKSIKATLKNGEVAIIYGKN